MGTIADDRVGYDEAGMMGAKEFKLDRIGLLLVFVNIDVADERGVRSGIILLMGEENKFGVAD